MDEFLTRALSMPHGYFRGTHDDRPYGVRVEVSDDGRRRKLYAEELGGTDRVSFNLYLLSDGAAIFKPCEMPAEKVRAFVLGFRPTADRPAT